MVPEGSSETPWAHFGRLRSDIGALGVLGGPREFLCAPGGPLGRPWDVRGSIVKGFAECWDHFGII